MLHRDTPPPAISPLEYLALQQILRRGNQVREMPPRESPTLRVKVTGGSEVEVVLSVMQNRGLVVRYLRQGCRLWSVTTHGIMSVQNMAASKIDREMPDVT